MLHRLFQNVSALLQTMPTPTIFRLGTVHTERISCRTTTSNMYQLVLPALPGDSDYAAEPAEPEGGPEIEPPEIGVRPVRVKLLVTLLRPPPKFASKPLIGAATLGNNCLAFKSALSLIATSRFGDSVWTSADGGQEYSVDTTGLMSAERGT